ASYMVSEFVEGETLADLLARGAALDAAAVGRIFTQAAEGLGAAHALGVIHRDVSPDNVMIVPGPAGPAAKVVDFGLAREVAKAYPGLTADGLVLGKLGYASPEQMGLLRDGDDLDARSDVFSLAALLYRVVCGRLPWRGDTLQGYLHDLIVRPERELEERLVADAAPAWREVLRQGLARDRERRTPSMEALGAGIARSAVRANGGPAASRPRRARGRWAAAALLAAAGAGALLWRGAAPAPGRPGPTAAPAATAPRSESPPATTVSAAPLLPAPTPAASPRAVALRPAVARVEPTGAPPTTLAGPTPAPTPLSTAASPPPAAPAAEAFGSLAVTSEPWVEVSLDRGPAEPTPVFLARVPAGRHALRTTRAGYKPISLEVEVEAGRTQTLRLTPEKEAPPPR
ncbi:MAG TPA: protein kinase, partial [Vicinamibacteria bacterium]